jgi:DNA-binding CsgD family transcriptional regulator
MSETGGAVAVELLGRRQEMGLGERFLDDVLLGAAALVFEGDPGIGKTAVWSGVVDDAVRRGFRVLLARPSAAETSLSYSALADLLQDVGEDVFAALPQPQRDGLAAALLRAPASGRAPDQRAIFTAFTSALAAVAASVPLLVAVDDVQWLDSPSARALAFAARRAGRLPIGYLLTLRADASPVTRAVLDGLPPERTLRCRLGPLSVSSLYSLIDARLGRALRRPTLLRVHEVSNGNPFFALEIAAALGENESLSPGDPLPVPTDVLELVSARTRELSPEARQALLAAAALAHPTKAFVESAPVEEAERAGLVAVGAGGEIRFVHPLYAAAIYDRASPSERQEVHRALAARVTDIEERARHLALAVEGPDEEIASTLERAAAQAAQRGAPDVAGALMDRARALTPPDHGEAAERRALHAAEHLFHAGNLEGARQAASTLLPEVENTVARSRLLRLLGEISFRQTSFDECIAFLRASIEEAGDEREARTASEVTLAFALSMVGDLSEAQEATERARAVAGEVADGATSVALAASVAVDFLSGNGFDRMRLERALELEDREFRVPGELQTTTIAAVMYLHDGEFTRARSYFAGFLQELSDSGQEADAVSVIGNLAWLECLCGDLALARELAAEGADLARQTEARTMGAFVVSVGMLAAAHAGDAAAVRAGGEEVRSLLEGTSYQAPALFAAAAQGFLALSVGDADGAERALAPLTGFVESFGLPEPTRAFFLPDAIEALVILGRLEAAVRLTDLLEERGRVLDGLWARATGARCRALVRAAQGDLAGAAEAAHAALRLAERLEMPLERARILLVMGQVQRRRRAKRAAATALDEAVEILERIGASAWLARARAERARVSPRMDDDEALTPTEARIAELASTGLRNREVAQLMFISPKTVEANLARVYRKLGISSRAELGQILGAVAHRVTKK